MILLIFILFDKEEVMMGREFDKLFGVVLVFEVEELVCVYFVILFCMGLFSFFKFLLLLNLLVLLLEMILLRFFKV